MLKSIIYKNNKNIYKNIYENILFNNLKFYSTNKVNIDINKDTEIENDDDDDGDEENEDIKKKKKVVKQTKTKQVNRNKEILNQIFVKEFKFPYNDIKIENSSLGSSTSTSSIKKKKKQKECLTISIDEAGKGSLLGPLVVSCVVLDPKNEEFLKQAGVKDSKLLSPSKREYFYNIISEKAIYHQTIVISNHELDKRRSSHTLNEIGTNIFFQLIKDAILNLAKNQQVKVIIDSIENNTEKYSLPFRSYFSSPQCEIVCETKADFKYVSVGAASILAKVKRDQYIKSLEFELDQPIGSGYPSDQITIDFVNNYLKKNFEFPDSMRKSWNYSGLPKKDQQFLLSFKKNNEFNNLNNIGYTSPPPATNANTSSIINNSGGTNTTLNNLDNINNFINNSLKNNNLNNSNNNLNNNSNNSNNNNSNNNSNNNNNNNNNNNLINNLMSYLKNNNNKLLNNLDNQIETTTKENYKNIQQSHQNDNTEELFGLFKKNFDSILMIQEKMKKFEDSLNELKNIIQNQQQNNNNTNLDSVSTKKTRKKKNIVDNINDSNSNNNGNI